MPIKDRVPVQDHCCLLCAKFKECCVKRKSVYWCSRLQHPEACALCRPLRCFKKLETIDSDQQELNLECKNDNTATRTGGTEES